MRDQETDRGRMAIIGGPSLERVTELSTEWFRFWNSISSWGFRFEGYKMWCGFISLDQFSFKGGWSRGPRLEISSLWREVSFVSRVFWGGQGRRIGSRGDAYTSSFSIGFPSFEVSGEGDKGEGPNMFYPQPPSVISNLNSLFLFTSTMRATTSSPLLVREKASAQGLMKSQQLVRTRFWLAPFFLLGR